MSPNGSPVPEPFPPLEPPFSFNPKYINARATPIAPNAIKVNSPIAAKTNPKAKNGQVSLVDIILITIA